MDGKPVLATIIVGNNPVSELYVSIKEKECVNAGIEFIKYAYPTTITGPQLIGIIETLNNERIIDGILIQLPLPKKFNTEKILKRIDPDKDVDGLNPISDTVPCAVKGIMRLLKEYKFDIKGKEIVIVNHSRLIGIPLTIKLLDDGATVTICHKHTKNLKKHTLNADILITAVGKRNIITEDMVKQKAIVIDAGICCFHEKTEGDVDFKNVRRKVAYLTPVPGGIGPMTIAMLIENLIENVHKKR